MGELYNVFARDWNEELPTSLYDACNILKLMPHTKMFGSPWLCRFIEWFVYGYLLVSLRRCARGSMVTKQERKNKRKCTKHTKREDIKNVFFFIHIKCVVYEKLSKTQSKI